MKDGFLPASPPGKILPPPPPADDWKFAIEIFPSEWKCPPSAFWIAGWIISSTGRGAADVRARFGSKVFLGLCGLPRADAEQAMLGHVGPPHAGFSFLLSPENHARELRLEACDEEGNWREFFRREISSASESSSAPPHETLDATSIARAALELLLARREKPSVSWRQLGEAALASVRALPLDALPNPPLYGRLELPRPLTPIRHGLLEISGWLAHREQRVKRLLAFIEPTKPVTLLHGRPRHDVSDLFGELREGATSQFSGFIAVPAHFPRPLCLRIIAELENGEQHLAFNRRFQPQVLVEAPSALPPYSALTFGRVAATLWQAARRTQVSLGPKPAFLAAVRPAAEEYRASAPVALPLPQRPSRPLPAVSSAGRPLKVVVVTHNLNREGAPLIALEYAIYLARQPGWQVRVVSAEEGPLRESFAAAGIAITIENLTAVWSAQNAPELTVALDRLAARVDWRDADLIVANTMVAFWAIHLAQRLGKPSLLYVHESASVRRFFGPLASAQILPGIEQAFGLASLVVFAASASQIPHLPHERRHNFRVVPSWIDSRAIAAFCATNTPHDLRHAKKIRDDAVVFVNIGSVSERKGQHVFIAAIERLQAKRRAQQLTSPPLLFLMVGASPGPLTDFLRHEIALRQLTDVQIIAKIPDPFAYFRLADIFVCSSLEESLPRVVMEAAAFGLPIVSTAVNGIPEILAPADAWLVPPGDAAQLASGLESALAAHQAGDFSRAKNAQRKVAESFDARLLLPQHAALAAATAVATPSSL